MQPAAYQINFFGPLPECRVSLLFLLQNSYLTSNSDALRPFAFSIPQRNISLLSNRLAREGSRRMPEAVLERDYCLTWFLVSLSSSPICKNLIFKGGTALKRCYFSKYRFSEDLDFTLAEEMPLEPILAGFEKVYAEVYKLPSTFFVPHIGFYQRVATPNRYLAKDFFVFPNRFSTHGRNFVI